MSRGLHMRFDDPVSFRAEYERNIQKGGAFVRTSQRWELRTVVALELELAWCGESVSLEAEIVHCTPEGTDPRSAGVAVQFLDPIESLRERLGPTAAAAATAAASPPADATAPGAEPLAPPAPDETPAIETDPVEPEPLDLDPLDEEPPALELDDPHAATLPGGAPAVDPDAASAAEPEPEEPALEWEAPPPTREGDAAPEPPVEPEAPVIEGDDEETADEPCFEIEAEETQPRLAPLPEEPFYAHRALPPIAPASAPGLRFDPLEGVVERRSAERQTARLPVQVDASHISLDGRTRDISENGVLLSADGNDLPVGKKVTLSMTHPNTGERLTIEGVVARHVESQGTVAAVGIAFDACVEDDPHLRDFIREVQASETARRDGGISGVIEELGMANLLQMFGKSSRCGTLTVCCGAEEGVIAFQDGNLRYVRLGALRGVKAMARLLGWEHGAFEFVSQVDELPDEDEPVSLEAALLDAVRQLDEAAREEEPEVDLGAVLHLDRKALVQLDRELSQAEEAVLDLAAAGLTVRRLLDVIPESDAAILGALRSLRERGLVELEPPRS